MHLQRYGSPARGPCSRCSWQPLIPESVTLVPSFIVITRLGWYDTLAGLTVPFTASAFSIFLLRQFFAQLPNELLESARIDGVASELVVPADHSTVHAHPAAVMEVRRILLEHLAELSGSPARVASR